MRNGVMLFLVVLFLIPIAYSISIKDLIARYGFSKTTAEMNVTGFSDFMIDKNSNGINDTLVIELTTNNANGNFIFIINLFDKNSILTNETNITLNAGANKLNITLNSMFLNQNQFNYSIKVYNSTYSLKYRQDNILTGSYSDYEKGFEILDIVDYSEDKTLKINITLNSPINGTFEIVLFLSYNNSIIFSKENKSLIDSTNHLILNFDNETIKRTHYVGNFKINSMKIDKKIIKTNFTTQFYDFKDFAVASYILDFANNGTDTNNDGKYDILQINVSLQIFEDNDYAVKMALYDLFDNIIEIKNISTFLSAGKNIISFGINGSKIYSKKLNGPFIVKHIELFENGTLIDQINDAYISKNYNFNDFSVNLPDLNVNISISDEHKYGIGNATINFTFKNIGNKHAFNVFTEIFDNNTFFISNRSNILTADSEITYQINFIDISDFEISAIADLQDFVEELDESNNAERIVIELNKHPKLLPVNNITANELDIIVINLSAFDSNDDFLSFSINFSGFSSDGNIFKWNTTMTDSGNYTLSATVSDGFLNDSALFNIEILDAPENDFDNDGIDDSIDNLIGNEKSVTTSTINLNIFVGNTSNLSALFNQNFRVTFFDNNLTIMKFDFDFSKSKLNLTNLTIDKQLPINEKGSLLVKGVKMFQNTKKTVYVDRISKRLKKVCIKDEQIPAISNISKKCRLKNEFKIKCNGKLIHSNRCTYNETLNKFKVEGLNHTGVIQIK